MKYIHAIKGSAITFLVLIPIVILTPGHGPADDVELILTISTFLFAILAGFFLARLNTRYNDFANLASSEDAAFMSVYYTAKALGKKFVDKIRDAIDGYYIVCYDFDLGNQYMPTIKYFQKVYKILFDEAKNKNQIYGNVFDAMIVQLSQIESYRDKAQVIGEDKLTKGQWMILMVLSGIIFYSIMYLKVPTAYSYIISLLFSTTLVTILLTMRDLQNLMLSGKSVATESGQENFDNIGKLRYYNNFCLETGIMQVPSHIKKYRVGMHKPGEKFDIKVVTRK
ncbi:MAG: hypothetical protein NTZ80_04155 [Patescibacteria group bacterium]|nr:hypothetical protein [Patescibacteria group bacterium]